MVIDTSALIAIAQQEPEARQFSDLLAVTPGKLISAATRFECACVIMALRPLHGLNFINTLLADTLVETVDFDLTQLEAATDARRRYGRGSGHRAALNMGDCYAYALAKTRNLPLLFKGDDFRQTDIVPAV